MKKIIICAFLMLLLPVMMLALNDPFKRPKEVNSLLAYIKGLKYYSELFAHNEQDLKDRLQNTTVDMIYFGPNKEFAIINGKTYEQGDYYLGIKVSSIMRDSVVFQLPSGPYAIGVSANDIKKRPEQNEAVKKEKEKKEELHNPYPPGHPMHRRFMQQQMQKQNK